MTSELNRRRFLTAALAAPGSVALPAPLLAAAPRSIAAALGPVLAAATPAVSGARLDLVGVHHDIGAGGHLMAADISLVWPPGQRRRRIMARGPTGDIAFAALCDKITAAFGNLA